MRGFALVASQRSGSTWVVDTLNRLEGLKVYGEMFLSRPRVKAAGPDDRQRFFIARKSYSGLRKVRPFATAAYLTELLDQPDRCVGFKLMYSHLVAYPELTAFLALRGLSVIHLIRDNLLDQLISSERARQSGQFHSWNPDVAAGKRLRLKLDTASLVDRLSALERKNNQVRRMIALLRLSCFRITYEELVASNERFLHIANFLGVPQSSTATDSGLSRVRKGSQSDTVVNYCEVVAVLDSTPYARFLDDSNLEDRIPDD